MKKMGKVILSAKKIIDSGNSDAMGKARIYLESENMNETILLPSLAISQGYKYQLCCKWKECNMEDRMQIGYLGATGQNNES